jgi:hypothetical protein
MRRVAFIALLLVVPIALAAEKPNPAEFGITVRVITTASRQQTANGASDFSLQVLEATIDNQPVELTGYSRGLLALGNYKARIATSVHGPRNPNTYDIYKGYDLLMPDGTSRTYSVTRIGPAPANP